MSMFIIPHPFLVPKSPDLACQFLDPPLIACTYPSSSKLFIFKAVPARGARLLPKPWIDTLAARRVHS